MALIEVNKNPSRRELGWFGLLLLLFFGIVGSVVWAKTQSLEAALTIWGSAVLVSTFYYALPPLRKPLYLGWIYATLPMGWLVSHLLLALIFYLLITPIGLAMRLLGRDALGRKFKRPAKEYWIEHNPGGDPARYLRQF